MQALLDDVFEKVHGAWRFRWIALAVAWAVCVAGWIVAFALPDVYEASARVFVDTRPLVSQATQGLTTDTETDTSVQRVRQALLSGPQLERVGAATGLFKPDMTAKERQYAIEALRKRIQIAVSSSGSSGSVYQVSFEHRDRDTALRVVNEIVRAFVEGSLGGKRDGAAQARSFLESQAAEYATRLQAAERKLADFKKRNVTVVPGALGDYFTRLQAESEALARAETALGAALNRRAALQRQMRSEQRLVGADGGAGARAEAGAASTATAPAGDVATRIREAQSKLDELLVRFTEKHPEVVGLRQTIEELKARQSADIEAARRGDPGAAARAGLTASPVFQSIKLQYNQIEVEVAALQSDVVARRAAVEELRRMGETAPEAETELAKLNREYQLARDQHQAFVERLERARVGGGAGAALQFEVIDPPSALYDPVGPPRGILIVFVLVLGLAAGAGVAYLMQMLRPVFYSARSLREATGLPVLGAVSLTWLDLHRAREIRAGLRYAAAVGALAFCSLLVLLAQYRIARAIRLLVT